MRSATRTHTQGALPLVVLTAYGALLSLDVAMVGALLPRLQAELGFGDSAAGGLAAAGTVAAVVASLPAGRLSDLRPRPQLLGRTALLWAAATAAVAVAPTFGLLVGARVLLGVVNAVDNPVASSLLTELYPARRRARVFAVHRFGTFLGTPLGLLGGAALGAALGWRRAFAVVVPMVLLVGWAGARVPEPRGSLPRATAPPRHAGHAHGGDAPRHAASEAGARGAGASTPGAGRPLRALLEDRTLRAVLAAAGLLGVPAGAVVFWLPSVWQRDHGLAEGPAGAAAGLVVVVGLSLGVLLGGLAGDRGGGGPARRIRVATVGVGIGVVPFALGLLADGFTVAVAALALGMCSMLVALPNLAATIGDLAPPQRHGLAFAASNMLTALGAALGPLLVGWLAGTGLRLGTALGTTALAACAAAVLLVAARPPRR